MMNIIADIEAFFKKLFEHTPTADEKAKYLDNKAATTGGNLNWRNSTVDLLKLMGQDSSLEARAVMAKQLGYPGPGKFTGTAEQNIWLHQQLMSHLQR
jgi:hypothetical protein